MEKFIILLVAVYLALPASVVEAFPLMEYHTPDTIRYHYLDVKMGILHILILLIFFYIPKDLNTYILLFTLFVVLLRDSFADSEYPIDLFLSYLFGIFLYGILTHIQKIEKLETFLIIHIMLVLLSQLISYWFGMNKIEGRINAPYLDVGSTGVFYSILGLLYSKSKLVHIAVFFVTLLSGSRIGLVLYLILFILIYKKSIPNYVFVLFGLGIFAFSGELIRNLLRVSELTSIGEDDSLLGRIASFKIGLSIQEFGIGTLRSGELVSRMREGGYPSFPHSTFLVYLFILPIYVLLSFKSILRLVGTSQILMLIMLLVFFFQGGLLITFKSFGLSLFIFLNVYNFKRHRYI